MSTTTTLDDLYYYGSDAEMGMAEELAVSVENDEYQRLRREGKTKLSLNDWLNEQHDNKKGQTMQEWAYAGDVERVRLYEQARNGAVMLLEHWRTKALRDEPTLPCPLWKRKSDGTRQPIRMQKTIEDMKVSHEVAGRMMLAYEERDAEIKEAQVNNEPTIPFHFTHSLQDATHYYLEGSNTACTLDCGRQTTTLQIPTPPADHGPFQERIAVSTTAVTDTATWISTGSTAGDITWTASTCPTQTTTLQMDGLHGWTTGYHSEAYYMQGGNWSGPHVVEMPASVIWTVTTHSTGTTLFCPPQHCNTYGMGIANGAWQDVFTTNNNQQELGSSPECDFERIVKRHEIENAYIRSKKLLKMWLKPEEYYSLTQFGYMIVPSKLYPNVDYWVHDDDYVYVDAYDNDHTRIAEKYCLHSVNSKFQKYDKILSKILLLKADEAEFLRRAIKHGGDGMGDFRPRIVA